MYYIGQIYKNKDSLFVADSELYYENSGEKYIICYNVKLGKADLRGADKGYFKVGRPFILSSSELEVLEPIELPCSDCLFYESRHSFENAQKVNCSCEQHILLKDEKTVAFVPKCKLFRPKCAPYEKTILSTEENKLLKEEIFKDLLFEGGLCYKSGVALEPSFGVPYFNLSEDEFDDLIENYVKSLNERVIVIKDISKFVEENEEAQVFSVKTEDFDYSFIMHECSVLQDLAFVFEKSKIALVFWYENLYVLH